MRDRHPDRGQSLLGQLAVDGEAEAPYAGELARQPLPLGGCQIGVRLGELLARLLGEQCPTTGGQARRQRAAGPVPDAKHLVALDGGDEAHQVAVEHEQVRGLPGRRDQPLQVGQGELAKRGGRARVARRREPGRAGGVPAVAELDGEVAVDEHAEQAVRCGRGHPQPASRFGDAQRALLPQQHREQQRGVDRGDGVGRLVLHSRKA